MSLSAVDHYAVHQAERHLDGTEATLEVSEENVNDCRQSVAELEARLEEARQELAQAEMDHDECETDVANAKERLKEARAVADTHVEKSMEDTVIDPATGLPQGKEIPMWEKHAEWISIIQQAREAMSAGDLQTARDLEKKATKMYRSFDCAVDARAVGLPSAFQVNAADLLEPHSSATEEEIQKTFEYAKEQSLTNPVEELIWSFVSERMRLNHGSGRSTIPVGVNPYILGEIALHYRYIERKLLDERDEHREMEDDETDVKMTDEVWSAIEKATRNGVAYSKEKSPTELVLPRPNSAPIARYNPAGHFSFKSEEASTSIDGLVDALTCCKLPSRPADTFGCEGRVRRPLEIPCSDIKCMDIDGDMMAMCGEMYPDSLHDNDGYVGHRQLPGLPVNLDSAESSFDLKDSNGIELFQDTNVVFEEEGGGPRRLYFSYVAADADGKRVWASSSSIYSKGKVYAFSTEDPKKKSQTVAMLAFDEEEKKAQSKFVNSKYPIVKCNDCIVGSGGTGRLSIWNMQQAVEEYEASPQAKAARDKAVGMADHSDSHEDSDTRMEEEESGISNKKQKTEDYIGTSPRFIEVEEGGFACGDIQGLGEGSSQMLIAPQRISGECSLNSIRLFDLARESAVGIFMGNRGEVSIEKQYCADSHNLIFSMDGGTGFVWDIRTFQPVFALHTKSHGQILGVPASSPVAFTFNAGSESVSCWDLRMPASHAYTMATGNTNVTSMLWHEPSASLIASTRSDHTVVYGKSGGEYMYGENCSFDYLLGESSATVYPDWPRCAKHEPSYFGATPWNLDGSLGCVLQYAFDTKG